MQENYEKKDTISENVTKWAGGMSKYYLDARNKTLPIDNRRNAKKRKRPRGGLGRKELREGLVLFSQKYACKNTRQKTKPHQGKA